MRQQLGHRTALGGDLGIAMQLTKTGIHAFSAWKQLLQLHMTRGRFQLGLDAGPLPVKPERIAQGAARHPEVQGCESKHFILQLDMRSEEHTSELQSLMRISYAVFCLKKKITECNTTFY